jgi:hypothetical protein
MKSPCDPRITISHLCLILKNVLNCNSRGQIPKRGVGQAASETRSPATGPHSQKRLKIPRSSMKRSASAPTKVDLFSPLVELDHKGLPQVN